MSKTVSSACGFVTTSHERVPRSEEAPVANHVAARRGKTRLGTDPGDRVRARTTQPAAIHPPKYSTYVEEPISRAGTSTGISPPAGTRTSSSTSR